MRERERERVRRKTERKGGRWGDRQRERKRETERDRLRDTETERERERKKRGQNPIISYKGTIPVSSFPSLCSTSWSFHHLPVALTWGPSL
jgi:hypothetical protein